MSRLLNEYKAGDMRICYRTDGEGHVELLLLPESMPYPEKIQKDRKIDSLAQLKLTGDIYDEAYAMGNSMRNGETVRLLQYREQTVETKNDTTVITTVLEDERQNRVSHYVQWHEGRPYLKIWCAYENRSGETRTLEMFDSFSLAGLTPYIEGDAHGSLTLHRIRSVWSMEGRPESIPIEELQLEPAWDPHAVRCEKYGQVGSMPVNKFFPFVAVEDQVNQVYWGAQLAHNASWQMTLYRKDDGLAVSGGLADRDFGQWMKEVGPGETFTTPTAIVSVARTDSFDVFTGRLTEAALDAFLKAPKSEQELPLIFNEYCTTWGNPSHENICAILEAIKDKGFSYFVVDCGWYKEKDIPWDIAMGDYVPSKELFPEGLEKTAAAIREKGLVPGIWFEIETVGKAARAYHQTEHLLQKDGRPLTSYFRRFWNMSDPWVEDYLSEKVIGTLQKYGFGYMKIDYNETIGAGCDGAESIGEGLRKNMASVSEFIEKIKREAPGIILENCSSGGHRLEPGLMAQMSMASFSDAHECREIPIIAANLHRVIHPAQSQIWAVIRREDSLKRIAYSVANTFLGRMCISGDVTELTDAQWKVIDSGIAFYKKIAPVIKRGQTYQYRDLSASMRHPEGWQAVLRTGRDSGAYALFHTFGGRLPEEIRIPLPEGLRGEITEVFSEQEEAAGRIRVEGGELIYLPSENDQAAAALLN